MVYVTFVKSLYCAKPKFDSQTFLLYVENAVQQVVKQAVDWY